MSKLYSCLLGLGVVVEILGSGLAQAQNVIPRRTCGTQEADALAQAELQRRNPAYNPAKSTNTAAPILARGAAVTYTLPVVVHVIHNGEAVGTTSNISQAQIQSQIAVLNEDYRNRNADGATVVPSVYQSRRADVQIQFVLATRDPNGATMAEPGIDRVNRNTKGFTAPPYTQAYNQATIKPQTYWNPEQYVNIWVENLGSGLLGYAQFPDNTANLGGLSASGGAANTDGVVILYSAFGSKAKYPGGTYTTSYDQGRTLTHELGHWFSLRHIWGDATCGTDYCTDTPPQNAANYGCVTFPQVTCSNVTGDMSQNYMDYSDDRCMALFTTDQATRVQAVMAAGTPRRANLVNSPALCTTTVAVTAANNGPVCVGGSIALTASGPTGATYAWTGPNNFTSASQNPTITNVVAGQAGTYTVTATVAGSSSCPGQSTTTVTVNPAPPTPTITSSATAPICVGGSATLTVPAATAGTLPSADFNSGLPTGWTVANAASPNTQWQVSTGNTYTYSGGTGGYSVTNFTINNTRFAFANSDAGGSTSTTNTTLTTPSFSTMGYSTLSLTFQHIFYIYSGSGTVEVSSDGGTTWTTAVTYTAQQGDIGAPATATVSLNAFVNRPDVRVRWHYVDVYGYLWGLDNVALTGTAAPATSYAWTLVSGNGLPTTTTGNSLTVSPTQNSVYRVTTTYAGSTCSSSATAAVQVIPTPTLAASVPAVCPGGSAQLSASNISGTGYTYAWTLVSGDGLPTTTNVAGIAVSPTQNSVYRLTVGYTGSTCTTTSTIAVQVIPTPVLTTSTPAVCPGGSAQLSAANVTGTGYTYSWTLVSGDGLPATTNAATLTVSPTQNSVYRLTVGYPGASCTTTATVAVPAVPTPTLAASVPAVCPGGSAQLSAANVTGTGYTYSWTLVSGDGLPATTTNVAGITVSPTQNSVYRLTVGYPGSTCTTTSTIAVQVIPTPTLVASVPAVCPGGSAQLSASNISGTGYTYAWTLLSGDGLPTTTNAATLTVSPTQSSVYRLTVSYPGSTCTTASTIIVQVIPAPTLVASTPAVCPGGSAQLSASNVASTGYTYAWTLVSGDGLPATTNVASIAVSPTQNSVYRLTIGYPGASCTTTSTIAVQAVPTPVLAASTPAVCPGSSAQLSASNVTGTGYTYTWTLVSGDGLPTATNTATLTVSPTQSSVYRLTVGYPGASCTTTATIAVQAVPTPVLAASTPAVCPGGSAQLSAANVTGTGYTYTWTLVSGDGLPATTTNVAGITVSPTQNSVYRLTVGYPGSTCTTTSTVAVQAVPTPALVTSAALVCPGSTAQLSASNVTGTGYTYSWTLVSGNGLPTTTTGATLTVSPTQNSVYRLTVGYPGSTCTTTSTVAVQAVPTPTLVTSAATVCPRGTAQLSASNVTGAGYTYAWTVTSGGNGLPTTTTTPTITVTPTQTSTYTLTVNGCTTGTVTVTVNSTGCVTATTPALTAGVRAYPVPFGSEGLTLAVSAQAASPLAVQLYDVMGRRVYNHTVASVAAGEVNVALPGTQHLPTGKYLVKVQVGGQNLTLGVVRY